MSGYDLALSVALGIGLAAAVGFRVFLPLLVISAAAWTGHLPLGEFCLAWNDAGTCDARGGGADREAAYYVPGVDNLLDTITTPAAFVAGTIASAAVMTDLPPLVKWTTAVIAGGGAAGLMQGITAALRANSTLMTGGLGNSLLATGELVGALAVSLLALAFPLAALAVAVLFAWIVLRLLRMRRRSASGDPLS